MHLLKSVSSPDCGPLQLDKPDEMKAFVGNTWKIILAASARHIWLECEKLLFLQQGSSNRKSSVNKKVKGSILNRKTLTILQCFYVCEMHSPPMAVQPKYFAHRNK